MGNRPWMPLYVADYRADTAHLGALEHGAYLLLIMHYWQTGGLPDNDLQLARIACVTAGEWKRVRDVIALFFLPGWKHKRIDAEIAHAEEVSSKRRSAAYHRYSNSDPSGPTNVPPNGHANADAKAPAIAPAKAELMQTHARTCAPALQSQSQRTEEREGVCASHTPRARAKPATPIGDNWVLSEQGVEYARSKGWSDNRISNGAERFRDHAIKRGKTYRDWEAAWRNWVTSPYQAEAPPRQAAQVMSFKEKKQKEWDDVRQRLREYADEPEGGRENGRAPVGLFPKAIG